MKLITILVILAQIFSIENCRRSKSSNNNNNNNNNGNDDNNNDNSNRNKGKKIFKIIGKK